LYCQYGKTQKQKTMTAQEILNILKNSHSFCDIKKNYSAIGCDVNILSYSNASIDGNNLSFNVQLEWVDLKSEEKGLDNEQIILLIGYKTKSGYLSTKKLGLNIQDVENLSFDEVVSAISLQTDAINKSFDPFFAQNNYKRNNAAAWVSIAANNLQDDCR